MDQRTINPWKWQDHFGFVQGTEISGAERVLYCAGQASIDAEGRPVHAGDMRAQIGQVLDNLETVLSKSGFSLPNIVRLNYYTTDVDLFVANSDIVKARVAQAGCHFASTLLGVGRLAYPELLIEMEATAVK